MLKSTPKLPKSGGAQKALDTVKKLRNQQPSDNLVKIIFEYENDSLAKYGVNLGPIVISL